MLPRQNIATIFFLVLGFQIFGQSARNNADPINDTLQSGLQPIYIDYNPNSAFYHDILDFNFLMGDQFSYNISLNYLQNEKMVLDKKSPIIPWQRWVALKQYHKQWYVYHPCDFLFHFRQSINDSSWIDWTGEGPVANKILEQKKIQNDTYSFRLTGIYGKERMLLIHLIDADRGIAVFEERNFGSFSTYYLMIAAEKANQVPIIVHHCPRQKQLEWRFEEPNFDALLRGRGIK